MARSRTFFIRFCTCSRLISGFSITSSAPLDTAAKAVRTPVSAVTTRIGTGFSAMIRSMASNPPITGISISMVTISGLSAATLAMASIPFEASPTTTISGSDSRMARIMSRTSSLSSTSRTRMIFPCFPIGQQDSPDSTVPCPVPVVPILNIMTISFNCSDSSTSSSVTLFVWWMESVAKRTPCSISLSARTT